ncbi:MerC domain-containing protein [Novosphingobium sp.]|uniref:MerC domain-containing protein n=1 Tax=Novosphingobium sp. TaxID=1874826 RepID=UPI001DF3EC13|nr:MerC domain-containing protein [Novosphingobium sp.]MBX9661837.1 MerC domain-containing protein [Novosphingobium sp.]
MTDRPDSSPDILRGRFDRLGVLISGLCMVHCVAGLFLISVLGLGGGVLLNPAIHRFGLIAAFLVGMFTIGAGALRHGHRLPLALGTTGLALMAAAIVSDHGTGEALLTICGVMLVASAHIVNLRRNTC